MYDMGVSLTFIGDYVMKSFRFLGIAVVSLAFAGFAIAAPPQFKADEILIKVKPGQDAAAELGVISRGGSIIERYPQVGWVRVRVPAGKTADQSVTIFRPLSFAAKVEKNVIYYPHAIVNDPLVPQQWLVNRIRLPEAWDLSTGSNTIKIAVIDTGVFLTHADLVGNIGPGRDVVDDDNDASDEGGVGHGTHVSGIASASTNNGIGIAGVGYSCQIMPIRAGDFGFGGSELVEAITWAADNGAHVINMSLGGASPSQAIQDACTYARSKDVFICASAGNNGTTQKSYPAANVGVMAVTSSEPNDSKSGLSQYGQWVHVAAPGTNILSSVLSGGYEAWDGTSMSCPVVAGLAGLIWARGGSSIDSNRVFQVICDTAAPVPGNYVRYGRVDAYQALVETRVTAVAYFEPFEVADFVGVNLGGALPQLVLPDNDMYPMSSQVVGRQGSLAGMEVKFQLDRPTNELFNFQMNFRAMASRSATGMIWFYNQNTGNWDFIKAFPLKTTATNVGLKVVTNMNKYVDGSGVITMRLRGHIASGRPGGSSPFNFQVDLTQMQASYEVAP